MRNVFTRTGSVLIFLLSAGLTAYGGSGTFSSEANSAPAVPYQGYTVTDHATPVLQTAQAPYVSPMSAQRGYPQQGISGQAVQYYQPAPVIGFYSEQQLPPAPAQVTAPAPAQVTVQAPAPAQAPAPMQAPAPAQAAAPIQAAAPVVYGTSYDAVSECTVCSGIRNPILGGGKMYTGYNQAGGCCDGSCFTESECTNCPEGDFCGNGLFPAQAKHFGQLFIDGWISAGGSTHNEWPVSATAIEPNGNDSDFQMNQFYISMGREVMRGGNWDIGGRVDLLYGTDYLLASSLGLESYNTGDRGQPVSTIYHARPHWNSENGYYPEYGLAMPQAYAEIYAPIAAGLTVKLGHFYSPMGYESICSPSNFFYTHTYTMMYGEPQTETGALANLRLNNTWSLLGGFTQGWNVWEDNNDSLDVVGGVKWESCDRNTNLSMVVMSGDTVYSSNIGAGEPFNAPLTNYSLLLERKLNPLLTWVFQHDLGIAEDGAWERNANGMITRLNAHWYSITNYLFYQMAPNLSLGFRAEWFQDENHSRMGDGRTKDYLFELAGENYVDLSLGLNWKPTSWITLRPEVRWDYSDVEMKDAAGNVIGKAFGKNYDKDDLVTFGGDVLIHF